MDLINFSLEKIVYKYLEYTFLKRKKNNIAIYIFRSNKISKNISWIVIKKLIQICTNLDIIN
jgi:hypothetical protein